MGEWWLVEEEVVDVRGVGCLRGKVRNLGVSLEAGKFDGLPNLRGANFFSIVWLSEASGRA
jgi:hypothetical protein